MSAAAIEARLRLASDMAGSLCPQDRPETKIDLSGKGVEARLRMASALLEACRALNRAASPMAPPAPACDERGRHE